MKKTALIIMTIWPVIWLAAQSFPVPEIQMRDIDGSVILSTQMIKSGSSTLMVFWKESDRESYVNIEDLQEAWKEELSQYGVRMVAIYEDTDGSWPRVKPLVNGNGWEFETYIDINGEFRRALNVGDMSCAMLFDENQNLICRYNSACTGGQEFICGKIMDQLNIPSTAENYQAEK
jgi:hypothetical protein